MWEARIAMPNRPDPVKFRRAIELRRDMTLEERVLWQRLRNNQLDGYHFYRQKVLAGFIVDFCCPAARLVVEVDGGIHEQQVEYDTERDGILEAHRWRVIRFSNDDVRRNTAAVLERIVAACRETDHFSP